MGKGEVRLFDEGRRPSSASRSAAVCSRRGRRGLLRQPASLRARAQPLVGEATQAQSCGTIMGARPIYVYRLISNSFVSIDTLMLVWYICYEFRSRAAVMRGLEIGVEARLGVLH